MDALREHFKHCIIPSDIPKGHQKRFEARLRSEFQIKPLHSLRIAIYAAAAIVILLITITTLYQKNKIQFNTTLILANVSGEAVETEKYLQKQISMRLTAIDTIYKPGKDFFSFKKDMREFDESLESLKKDLKQTPGDQRIVDAVINTYLLEIESLDTIMNILNKNS
jgi:hypothetical protein